MVRPPARRNLEAELRAEFAGERAREYYAARSDEAARLHERAGTHVVVVTAPEIRMVRHVEALEKELQPGTLP